MAFDPLSVLYPSTRPPEGPAVERTRGAPFDPALMYPTLKPEAPRPPTERMRKEAQELHAMYGTMRDEIARDYRLSPDALPREADRGADSGDDRGAFDSWARSSGLAPAIRAELTEALALAGEAHQARFDDWAAESSRIFGADLEETVRLARSAVLAMPAEVRAIFSRTALGNHPGLIRYLADLARRQR